MPHKVEIEISSLLEQKLPINEVVSSCLESIHEKKLSKSAKNSYLYFALNSGAGKKVLRILREWPNKEKYFPWEVFLEALVKTNEKLSDEEFDELFNYFQVNGITPFMSPSYFFLNRKFKPKINEFRDTLNYKATKKIKLLWDKLNFIQGKNILDEEVNVLNQLKLYDTENPTLAKHLKRINKKISLDVFSQPKQSSFEEDYSQYLKAQLSNENLV